ncbi:hypothetical protein BCR42DRAFT_427212 [Absidia repens]|uniref:Complex 1 LYR protein domain-containing protein n=1 Tax=Absidia repens TaxID=90262 RepID=A0A1X2I075_9FUNG|nr:hypothetical protein BCR42DRAFT_427212 [Absidia repens]
MYRTFLKAANKAVPSTLQRQCYLRQRIRRQFEAFKGEKDPVKIYEWELRAKNTLSFMETASQRRGIENDIIKNLVETEYYRARFNKKSPFGNHKLKPEVRKLHNQADQDLELVIGLLNKELNLCL